MTSMLQAWEEDHDRRIKSDQAIEDLLSVIDNLSRGCHCEYDYRCSNCQAIIDAQDTAKDVRRELYRKSG